MLIDFLYTTSFVCSIVSVNSCSIFSLDSISDVSRFERSLIAPFDSYLQRDVDLRKKGQLGTSDIEVQTIKKHPTSQYIYQKHTKWR